MSVARPGLLCLDRPLVVGALLLGSLLANVPAYAKDPAAAGPKDAAPTNDVPGVPGDDIFGFTSVTDPGNPGDKQFFNENDGRVGKRDGSYFALNQKFAFGYTFAENWWVGFGAFTAYNRVSNVTGFANVDRFTFDGLSVELLHRVIERSATNPFAVTLTVEPRWGRVDPITGLGSEAFGATFKLFADAPIVPDTLYWGGNLQYSIANSQDPTDTSQWLKASQLLISSALAYQVNPNLFFGAEARFFTLSTNLTLSSEVGRALYLGPTMLWKATDKVAVNVTYQPQIYGRSTANPTLNLDLDNFERAQFRAKLNVAF